MTIQDFPVSFEELEPYFDHFEYVCGTSGKAGVINGQRVDGGNPFEGSRSREFPLGPNPNYLGAELFYKAAREMGYHPYPIPASNTSAAYTNPYGCQMAPVQLLRILQRLWLPQLFQGQPQCLHSAGAAPT